MKAQISTNIWRYTLWSDVLCMELYLPPTHAHRFPLHPAPYTGPCGPITVSPFLCRHLLHRLLPLPAVTSFLTSWNQILLQETDQSSPLLCEAFLTSLFTPLSTFLCTNLYCSTYHYVVKISVCFCTGLWTREEVLVKNKTKQKRTTLANIYLALTIHRAHALAQLSPTVTLRDRCSFYCHFIDEGTEA